MFCALRIFRFASRAELIRVETVIRRHKTNLRKVFVKSLVKISVNGVQHQHEVEPRLLLAHCLRDHCHLTGTHLGCETTLCGACTVLMDGKAIKSCTLFAVQADGSEITTVEGLARNGTLHPVQ